MLDQTLRVSDTDRLYRYSANGKPASVRPAMNAKPSPRPDAADRQDNVAPDDDATIIHRLFNQKPPQPPHDEPDYDDDTDWLPMQQEKPKRNYKGPVAGLLVGTSVVAIALAFGLSRSPTPPPAPVVATAPQTVAQPAPKPPPVKQVQEPIQQPVVQPPIVQPPVQKPPAVQAPTQQALTQSPPKSYQPEPKPYVGISQPEMVTIRGGTFLMGSNEDSTEQPIHKVAVQSFMLAKYPVTVHQWRECVDAQGCDYMPSNAGADNAPISNISWRDAQQYVTWLSSVTGLSYRLPSETEWEYAARGGSSTRYWWGDSMKLGMTDCKGCGGVAGHPQHVGMHMANPFGLYDIGGGVSEWVADCWNKDYHGTPLDQEAFAISGCQEHVLRGGAWNNDASYVRSASRDHYASLVRYPTHGLRVARSF